MHVLVTGSSGKIGRAVCELLVSEGHGVVGLDQVARAGTGHEAIVDTLLDRYAIHRAFERFPGGRPDAIVHTANHIHANVAPAPVVFGENCAINSNVFMAAVEAGVPRVVFISSVQVMLGGAMPDGSHNPDPPHELPISEAIACRPRNVYALSKRLAETMLDELTNPLGYDAPLTAVSLRMPYILDEGSFRHNLERTEPAEYRWGGNEAFSYLHLGDAASAIRRALDAPLTGHDVFWCAAPDPRTPERVGDLVEKWYREVPGAERAVELDSFQDCSKARERLGWVARRSLRAERAAQHRTA